MPEKTAKPAKKVKFDLGTSEIFRFLNFFGFQLAEVDFFRKLAEKPCLKILSNLGPQTYGVQDIDSFAKFRNICM
jgi:hypothetical protein